MAAQPCAASPTLLDGGIVLLDCGVDSAFNGSMYGTYRRRAWSEYGGWVHDWIRHDMIYKRRPVATKYECTIFKPLKADSIS
jgi:hypothetical protein